MRSSREVAFCYNRFGKRMLQQYVSKNLSYCFDDLGLEQSTLDKEVMKEVLQFRLSHVANNTHIITRLDEAVIAERYGSTFSDMLYQNLNHIEFTTSFNL